jgi:FkbM family methyltransferase
VVRLKRFISYVAFRFGFSIRATSGLAVTELLARTGTLLKILASSPKTTSMPLSEAFEVLRSAKSQLGQDVMALSTVGTTGPGFFVEFGATNGIDLSNTYLLEKSYGWTGILCEPARDWHKDLLENRSCKIDTRCVYSSSGQKLQFSETSVGELSTISSYMNSDANRLLRKKSATYEVESISLADLLSAHEAPFHIEFLSIDTEGSEYEILRDFDFSKYSFGLICVEHNFTDNRKKLNALLTSKGYSQVFEELSAFDDWYVGPKNY